MKKLLGLSDRSYFIFLFFFSLIIYSASIFRVKSIIWGDSLYYYAYTRSIVIDRDIDFSNEAYREDFGFPNLPEVSEVTQKITNKFSPGSSLLWVPAFTLGYLASKVFESVGVAGVADGYNFFTQFAVAFSSIIFSIVGLFFVYKFILKFFKKKVALLTTLFLYFTTQIFYYTSMDPLNSHSASFMLSALFLYLVVTFSRTKSLDAPKIIGWQKMILLGVLAGLITLVRNQDIVIIIPAAIYLAFTKRKSLMGFLNNLVLFWGSVFLVVSIQLFMTLSLYGQIGSPYLMRGEELSWFKPDFIRVLFSFGNGLFIFAPILILSVVGLAKIQFYSKLKKLEIKSPEFFKVIGLISLLAFALQLYVVAAWGREIVGGPYGSRMFISVLPHLALGLAFIIEKFKNHSRFFVLSTAALFLLFINNLFQTLTMLVRF